MRRLRWEEVTWDRGSAGDDSFSGATTDGAGDGEREATVLTDVPSGAAPLTIWSMGEADWPDMTRVVPFLFFCNAFL